MSRGCAEGTKTIELTSSGLLAANEGAQARYFRMNGDSRDNVREIFEREAIDIEIGARIREGE